MGCGEGELKPFFLLGFVELPEVLLVFQPSILQLILSVDVRVQVSDTKHIVSFSTRSHVLHVEHCWIRDS